MPVPMYLQYILIYSMLLIHKSINIDHCLYKDHKVFASPLLIWQDISAMISAVFNRPIADSVKHCPIYLCISNLNILIKMCV